MAADLLMVARRRSSRCLIIPCIFRILNGGLSARTDQTSPVWKCWARDRSTCGGTISGFGFICDLG
jgi:hypothetical protein